MILITTPFLQLLEIMFVLITYDVNTETPAGQRRLRKVAKACVDYGHRVQNSVFECELTEVQYLALKERIATIIDIESDNIRFYLLGKNWDKHIATLGKDTSVNVSGTLII